MPAVEHEGASIAFRVDGPRGAPALLLANSLGTTTEVWDDLVPALAQRFFLVRYDHRGHGDSTATPGPYDIALLARDALAVLDTLDIRTASVCGLSIGGAVAMWLAAHQPARVEQLVTCCSAPRFGDPTSWAERAAAVRAKGPASLLDTLMARWFTPGFADPGGAMRSRVEAMLRRVDPEGYAGCCEALATMDLAADVGRITAPTLVLAGALDPAAPPLVAAQLAVAIDSATLVVLANAAHLAPLEQRDRVAEAVLSHLCGPAAQRGDRVRRRVLGDEHVERARVGQDAVTAGFQDLVTRMAWGEIWTRPGLDARTRSCVTVAMLIALGRFDELELHLRGALRNGVSADELIEVLLQSAVYCGFPAANRAFDVAKRLLAPDGDG
jgi:3-oxoadipate enol-lactonase / 4-carboxymuconolactone decarboxylase